MPATPSPANEPQIDAQARRARPAWLRALGAADPPPAVTVDGIVYRLREIFKHDSWAATGLYGVGDERIICKFNRTQSLLGLPAAWIGRLLAKREAGFLARLHDMNSVPKLLGPVHIDGRRAPNAVARKFISGRPLSLQVKPADDFFANLATAVREMHAHDMAYVDLHKRENVLVGDDGRPYLIDFQVSFAASGLLGRFPPVRWWLGVLQQMDLYHLTKLHRKHRRDQCNLSGAEMAALRPGFVRFHRSFAEPLRNARRKLLTKLGVRGGRGRAESEQFTEAGLRDTRRAA